MFTCFWLEPMVGRLPILRSELHCGGSNSSDTCGVDMQLTR